MWAVWILSLCFCAECTPEWGFYGHRQINRHAVFAIPAPLNQFFRKHVAWLEEHGVDPDKRRYAVPQEYKRHYIDLDYHERNRTTPLGFDLEKEIQGRLVVKVVYPGGDTIPLTRSEEDGIYLDPRAKACSWPASAVDALIASMRKEDPHDEIWVAVPAQYATWRNSCDQAPVWRSLLVEDHFSPHGILPYWLEVMQQRLTNAFVARDVPLILRLAADIGHYIGDAHVPLHTTENYNGQLTGQHGIHGFWESRIPELFFEEWELITGPAAYIPDFRRKVWQVVRESNALVADVLHLEKEVRRSLSEDKIMCFEDRNTLNILTQCPVFARAYATAMDGMVEERFRASIHMVASSWYTAWIDAGQPDLWRETIPAQLEVPVEKEPAISGQPFGRPHE